MKQVNQGIKFIDHPAPSRWISDRRAIAFVAASTVIMAYGGILGPASIIVFYTIWLPKLYSRGTSVLKINRGTALPLSFAMWCVLTAFWSNYPNKSLYSALEFSSTVACAIVMAERVRIEAFIKGIIYGCTITLVTSLASGRYGTDPFSGTYTLVGLLGSKNVVGLFSDITILCSLLWFPNAKGWPQKLVTCVIPGVIGVFCLYQSKSATSILAILTVLALLAVTYIITRMPKRTRLLTFLMLATWFLVVAVAGHMLDWQREVLNAFGKSTTLTGRTTLWEKGISYGMQSPIVGHGFAAFWVKGNPLAEQLWYKFGINGRAGFHFHNLFINVFVECGVVGISLISLILITTLARSILLLLKNRMQLELVATLGFAILFSIRAFSEVDIVGTFGIGPMLFYALTPRLKAREKFSS